MEKRLHTYPKYLYKLEIREYSFSLNEGSGGSEFTLKYLYSPLSPLEFIEHLDSVNYLITLDEEDNKHIIYPKTEILYIAELNSKEGGERIYTYDKVHKYERWDDKPKKAYKHIIPSK